MTTDKTTKRQLLSTITQSTWIIRHIMKSFLSESCICTVYNPGTNSKSHKGQRQISGWQRCTITVAHSWW